MLTIYSKYVLTKLKISPLIHYQIKKEFRKENLKNSFKIGRRRSINNFQEENFPNKIFEENSINRFQLLIRPTIFTFTFVGCSFVTCSIWQYESHRYKISQLKQRWQLKTKSFHEKNQFLLSLKNLWNDLSESKKVISTIIGLNLFVFTLWRFNKFHSFLLKYFTSTPYKKNVVSMLLSTFSHYSGIHFMCNMYVLWSFSEPILKLFGKEQFFAVYLSGGVVSSWLSYLFKIITRISNISLGASGSIMCLLGAVCTQYPDAKLSIIFFPFFTFSAKTGLISLISFDLLGTIMKWRYLDHSAHLGGVLFGVFYIKYGYKYLWESLTPFIQYWHQLREKFK